ncbi:sialidase family protein [Luteitalea sp. TBR-22]|uniref:sialidase family protein n=1 Tax=Luteitalea sp. TBR-22 TaxID=2802971 RepID=UPI001EF54C6F|nr:sialidase family protein [Luteitalea sp. TBR-22]
MRLVVHSLTLATLAALTLVVGEAQGPAVRVVRVTGPDAPNTAEVSVAIDPTNRDHIVVSAYQVNRPGGTRVRNVLFESRDGGSTWREELAANPERRATQGDDAVTFGPDGTLYHSYIAFDGLRVARPTLARNGIFVRRRDAATGGWDAPIAVIDHRNTVAPFEDKPWPGVDRGARSPRRGSVYVAWTRFDEYNTTRADCRSEIHFSRSTDGGRSFAVPLRISDRQGTCLDDDDTVEGAVPAAGPDGEVYVAWSGPAGLVIDRSDDGGVTFGEERLVSAIPGGWDIDIPALSRSNGMPVTVVDGSDGPRRGTVYVAWVDARHGDPDVFVSSSSDKGHTWTTPVRVNADAQGNGVPQFFVWLALDASTGDLHVVYHERVGPTGTETRVVLARSADGGRTWTSGPVPLAPFTTTADAAFGDYNGIDASQGRVVAVFPHFVGEKKVGISVAIADR